MARRSEDLQGGDVFSVVVGLYDDLHVLIEGDEEAQKALQGELAEVAARHFGDIDKNLGTEHVRALHR